MLPEIKVVNYSPTADGSGLVLKTFTMFERGTSTSVSQSNDEGAETFTYDVKRTLPTGNAQSLGQRKTELRLTAPVYAKTKTESVSSLDPFVFKVIGSVPKGADAADVLERIGLLQALVADTDFMVDIFQNQQV